MVYDYESLKPVALHKGAKTGEHNVAKLLAKIVPKIFKVRNHS